MLNENKNGVSLQDICNDLPSELNELILAYAIVQVSEERNWRLGDTLKRTVPEDFELFTWALHFFRQKPKLHVEAYHNQHSPPAKCWFGLTSEVVLSMEMTTDTPQKKIFETCDFEKFTFHWSLTDSQLERDKRFVKSLFRSGPRQLIAKHWWYDKNIEYPDIYPMLTAIECEVREVTHLIENLEELESLREVRLQNAEPMLNLTTLKALFQSSFIEKIDIHSKAESAFKFSNDSESMLKKFENKLKLYADYVNGLSTLLFAQKTSDPTVVVFHNSECLTGASDIRVKHVVLTFPLRNSTPRNDKINFLDITGGSYSGTTFAELTKLKGLSVGSQKDMGVSRTLTESKKNIDIDWKTIQTLSLSIKALDLCGAAINVSSTEATEEMGKLQLPMSIEYLQCTPEQLTLFSIESTTSVHCLTLAISSLITESDVCWHHSPTETGRNDYSEETQKSYFFIDHRTSDH
ncbi:unnamed protein product [Ambrosiozyma monospora]|uniref:Unnamed protein product n=1 Tax=Ambrosiozyma monospora TaxID=43982 RepID=A0ACB5TG16_AMBMO|nr:unnamed protein product [Ambrosiozyma monospora]